MKTGCRHFLKLNTAVDHIVIGAATLEQGADFIKRTLGVDIPFGGVHKTMGTHNLLMQLDERVFLEVIAVNPDIPAPPHPRWFGLDDARVRKCIKTEPTLLTWVVNTQNIQSLLQCTNYPFGIPERISRGDLSWYFGLPEDGRLLAGGLLPYVIEWQIDSHPAGSMRDTGCRLQQIRLFHPNAVWLASVLSSIGVGHQVKIEALADNTAPYMAVTINTPTGIKELCSIIA